MKTLRISVVIPCHNQSTSLRETLVSLSAQSVKADEFEVIVVDDGSVEPISEIVSELELPYAIKVVRQHKQGPAAARNAGANLSSAELILFLDSDMKADNRLIEEHLLSLSRHSDCLVEGRRKPLDSPKSPLYNRFIDVDSNIKDEILSEKPIPFTLALTCNLSMPKRIFVQLGGFDEALIRWQDIDFGYRASMKGIQIFFNPAAIAYHNHHMPFHEYCLKEQRGHRLARAFFEKYPQMIEHFPYLEDKRRIRTGDSFTLMVRKMIRFMLSLSPILKSLELITRIMEKYFPNKMILRFMYWKIIGSYQLLGLREGKIDG